jgi:hypothetical protein
LTGINLLEILLRLLITGAIDWDPFVDSHRGIADCDPFLFPKDGKVKVRENILRKYQ